MNYLKIVMLSSLLLGVGDVMALTVKNPDKYHPLIISSGERSGSVFDLPVRPGKVIFVDEFGSVAEVTMDSENLSSPGS